MNTFLPYPNVMESVMALDNRRLGKQRIEALQIYKVLRGESTAWARHPAVTMWKGNEAFLIVYYNAAVCEWSRRGFKNSMPIVAGSVAPAPEWFGGPIHANHRARLLAKNPEFYAEYCWEELPTDINYYPRTGWYRNGKRVEDLS